MTKQEEFQAIINFIFDMAQANAIASYTDRSIPSIQKAIRLYFEIDRELNQEPFFITNYKAKGDNQMSGLAAFMTITDVALQIENTGAHVGLIDDYTRRYYNAVLKIFP
jgi:hypothetical protein